MKHTHTRTHTHTHTHIHIHTHTVHRLFSEREKKKETKSERGLIKAWLELRRKGAASFRLQQMSCVNGPMVDVDDHRHHRHHHPTNGSKENGWTNREQPPASFSLTLPPATFSNCN